MREKVQGLSLGQCLDLRTAGIDEREIKRIGRLSEPAKWYRVWDLLVPGWRKTKEEKRLSVGRA